MGNITLNVGYKVDQSFQFRLAFVQLISCTNTVLGETIGSLQGSDRKIIVISEVHELYTNNYDILHNVVSKWVGNTALFWHILQFCY